MAAAAESIIRFTPFFQKRQVSRVLDYGAGTLRNASFLADKGFNVYAADIPEQIEKILKRGDLSRFAAILGTDQLTDAHLDVDVVVSTYVLNIVPDGTEKSRYIKNIVLNLRPDGYLLIEVRCRIEAEQCGRDCHQKCPHCVKTYTHGGLDRLLVPYGFKRISHYYRRHALAVLYQLVNA